MNNITFNNFEEAGQAVLKFLHMHFGFDLWMITRTDGNDWIVLQSEDHGYNIKPGQVFHWADSFCSHMVQGKAPRIAPYSPNIPLYLEAPINKLVDIQAYIGQPLLKEDGSLFGTLCAIDPHPKSETLVEEAALFDLLAQMLSYILQTELRETQQIRKTEHFEAESLSDSLTGLFNRRAWDKLVSLEEERCKRYGHPTSVLIIDLNNLKATNDKLGHAAGDELIRKAAFALKEQVRSNDIVARLGGDEFAILSIETNLENAEKLITRIKNAFAELGLSAAIGHALRKPTHGLSTAIKEADEKMYKNKALIKSNNIN